MNAVRKARADFSSLFTDWVRVGLTLREKKEGSGKIFILLGKAERMGRGTNGFGQKSLGRRVAGESHSVLGIRLKNRRRTHSLPGKRLNLKGKKRGQREKISPCQARFRGNKLPRFLKGRKRNERKGVDGNYNLFA